MGFYEVTFRLNDTEFPFLKNLKKKELNKILLKIFSSGYQIHFPTNDKIEQQIEYQEIIEKIEYIKEEIKGEINNSEISDKINSLEHSLTKLIGLSSNSNKKGNFGENVLEEIFNNRYGDIHFEKKSSVAHSGDAWLHLPNDKVIMLESKNYTYTVNKDEIIKMQNDMVNHHIKWGILTSFNSMIQGMKELDYHTFNHNKETYNIIMISNLSSDIHKLDLGLQITRKLMSCLDHLEEFPWVVNDINQSLIELNTIIQKNYALRDTYYQMEKDIQKSLSNYHVILRDYQYEMEKKINEITTKIQSTMKTTIKNTEVDNYNTILEKYENKKILPLLVRFADIAQDKKWSVIDEETDNWTIKYKDLEMGHLKIQHKKVIFNMPSNDLSITLNLGKDKENKQNLEIIKSLKN